MKCYLCSKKIHWFQPKFDFELEDDDSSACKKICSDCNSLSDTEKQELLEKKYEKEDKIIDKLIGKIEYHWEILSDSGIEKAITEKRFQKIKDLCDDIFEIKEDNGAALQYYIKIQTILISLDLHKYYNSNCDKKISLLLKIVNSYNNEINKHFLEQKIIIYDILKDYYKTIGNEDESAEYHIKIKKLKEILKDKNFDNFDSDVKEKCTIETKSGNNVQSKGENLIANFLYNNDIDFDYDSQITLKSNEKNRNGYTTNWVRPDFYLNESGIVIEYWGLKGKSDYDSKMDFKKRIYKECRQKFISIYPEDLSELDKKLHIKLKRLGCDLE